MKDPRLAVYLDRLGLERHAPGLAALTKLHVRHLERVPFENLDIHLDVPIQLKQDAILAKILGGRGGFCYELNGAFAWLLRALGYDVSLLAARVPDDDGRFGMPYGHLALRIDLDEPVLADVGFGDCFVEPVPFEGASSVQRGREYRLRRTDDGSVLESRKRGAEWSPEYCLSTTPRRLAEFEAACRHHETSPESNFTKGPICTRLDGDARLTLHRNRLTRGGSTLVIESHAQWTKLLEEHFGIRIPGASVPHGSGGRTQRPRAPDSAGAG